ncbi:hypothetical protein AN477_17465 [Alicyclobacillus ferrooxydans]|uniref:Uncharacterized protein n=1 Tax=Alicyclobacillus ferrooxydans TaxID=471514 RepID=A0A0N8PNT2_9BACL|nr:hypothetical protein AN477_17465 [Alicyclobacillus ferrooxydans]
MVEFITGQELYSVRVQSESVRIVQSVRVQSVRSLERLLVLPKVRIVHTAERYTNYRQNIVQQSYTFDKDYTRE